MKKIITTLLLTGLMSVSLVGGAFAADSTTTPTDTPTTGVVTQVNSVSHIKVKDLQGYDQLLQLRADGKAIREQIKSDRSQLKDLILAARQAHNMSALQALKPMRDALKQQSSDLKTLWTTQRGNWQAMKEAHQANNADQMQTVMNQIVSTRQAINAKLGDIKATLDQMIQSLQAAPAPVPPVTPGATVTQ